MSVPPPGSHPAALPTEPCAACGAPLAHDQRYCLHCGERRTDARLPFMEILAGVKSLKDREGIPGAGGALVPVDSVAEHVEEAPTPKWMAPLLAAAAVASLAIMLAVGIMIGGDDQKVASAPPPVVVGGGPGGGSGTQLASATEFVSDWPPDKEGWTVQLQTLPIDGTDLAAIAAAKTAAEGKGATKVGALRSDDFSSLDAGNYVIYSGQFDDEKGATAALKAIKKDFPDAKIIEVTGATGGGSSSEKEDPDALSGKKEKATVSRNQLNELENTSPEDYSKKSAKLPDQTVIPGKPPPTDNRAPAGGGGGVTIP